MKLKSLKPFVFDLVLWGWFFFGWRVLFVFIWVFVVCCWVLVWGFFVLFSPLVS